MSGKDGDDGLLSRWSRRKSEARAEVAAPLPEMPEAGEADDARINSLPTHEQAEQAREAELRANRETAEAVDLDRLDAKSDFSVFMKDGVPETLRRRALALLWRTNPVFANVDGLVDYDDDFASPDLIMKTFQSAWQAGRGYLREEVAEPVTGGEADKSEGQLVAHDDAEVGDALQGEEEAAQQNAVATDVSDEAETVELEPSAREQTYAQRPENEEAQPLVAEAEQPPRISLRRRLSLDSNGR